jgi:hypothetical protein
MEENDLQLPQEYTIRLSEVLLIIAGAALVFGAALLDIGVHAVRNAFDDQKAEAIAKSLMSYKIPEGSTAQLGLNIGAVQMALITSKTTPPHVGLLMASLPVNPETNRSQLRTDFMTLYKNWIEREISFNSSRVEDLPLCGATVPVTIQEGQLILETQVEPIPIIQYLANINFPDSERIIILFTNGPKAKENAASVFKSLECK